MFLPCSQYRTSGNIFEIYKSIKPKRWLAFGKEFLPVLPIVVLESLVSDSSYKA